MKRRPFLGILASLGLAAAASKAHARVENNPPLEDEELKKALDQPDPSRPLLQRPTKDSVSVAWSVERPSTGWVEWGTTPDLGNTARSSIGGLNVFDERFLSAKIEGLQPGTTYYYRTVTQGMEFIRYGKLFSGNPVYGEVNTFTTADETADTAKFAIFSDTHETIPYLQALAKRIDEFEPQCVIWNGDLLNDTNSADQAIRGILKAADTPWNSNRPAFLTGGNHDHRGPWARKLTQIFLPQNETCPKYHQLIYNFAYRIGPVAIIGLDTGEDKPDFHPIWSGLSNFDAMRVLQAEWLEETLNRPEIASAPFVVAVCHIPLYAKDPNANPGEILDGWAYWQRRCAELWTPVLNKYKVQVVVTGHLHNPIKAEPADENRGWVQMHGGAGEEKNRTIILGQIEDGRLVMRRENLTKGEVDEELFFDPRS